MSVGHELAVASHQSVQEWLNDIRYELYSHCLSGTSCSAAPRFSFSVPTVVNDWVGPTVHAMLMYFHLTADNSQQDRIEYVVDPEVASVAGLRKFLGDYRVYLQYHFLSDEIAFLQDIAVRAQQHVEFSSISPPVVVKASDDDFNNNNNNNFVMMNGGDGDGGDQKIIDLTTTTTRQQQQQHQQAATRYRIAERIIELAMQQITSHQLEINKILEATDHRSFPLDQLPPRFRHLPPAPGPLSWQPPPEDESHTTTIIAATPVTTLQADV
jgi:hypothetical protein